MSLISADYFMLFLGFLTSIHYIRLTTSEYFDISTEHSSQIKSQNSKNYSPQQAKGNVIRWKERLGVNLLRKSSYTEMARKMHFYQCSPRTVFPCKRISNSFSWAE